MLDPASTSGKDVGGGGPRIIFVVLPVASTWSLSSLLLLAGGCGGPGRFWWLWSSR